MRRWIEDDSKGHENQMVVERTRMGKGGIIFGYVHEIREDRGFEDRQEALAQFKTGRKVQVLCKQSHRRGVRILDCVSGVESLFIPETWCCFGDNAD